MYSEAKDKDFVIVFSPGGWGRDLLENSPDWESIFAGMKSELESFGYRLLALEYKRTERKLARTSSGDRGSFEPLPWQGEVFSFKYRFLTKHIPHLRVIWLAKAPALSFVTKL